MMFIRFYLPDLNLSKRNCSEQARIKYTDEKINQLVIELYGLSEEEVGIVEGKKN